MNWWECQEKDRQWFMDRGVINEGMSEEEIQDAIASFKVTAEKVVEFFGPYESTGEELRSLQEPEENEVADAADVELTPFHELEENEEDECGLLVSWMPEESEYEYEATDIGGHFEMSEEEIATKLSDFFGNNDEEGSD